MTGQPLCSLAEVNVLLSWCDSLASLDSGFQKIASLWSVSQCKHPSIKYSPLVIPRRQNQGGIKK